MAVYVHMMTCASAQPNATERGKTLGWCDEDIATALDIETEQVVAIREAMEGRVRDGDYLTGWDRRQSIREDEGAAQRAKEFREREKAKKSAEKNAQATQPNATERNRTPDVDVDVDVDVDNKNTPLPPAGGAVSAGQLSIAFRASGVRTQPANPILIELAAQGVLPDAVMAACEDAKAAKPGEVISLGYVAAILKRWAAEAKTLDAKGAVKPVAVACGMKHSPHNLGANAPEFKDPFGRDKK